MIQTFHPFAAHGTAARADRYPHEPDPDTRDPRRDDGPDDTSDPDAPRRDSDTFNGPDGPIDYPEYL